jgi:hypothetical protein
MTARFAANTRVGAGALPALYAGGEASTRTPATQLATDGPQRVRALGRATRSANGSGWCQIEDAAWSSARRSQYAGRRRSEKRLQLVGGGPSLLTEDRQKPNAWRCGACELGRQARLDGWHGTRNTVPSRAFNAASYPAGHCRRQRRRWMEARLRGVRPELPAFAEGTVAALTNSTPRA